MKGKKLNLPRNKKKFLFKFIKDKVTLPSKAWKVHYDVESQRYFIRKENNFGEGFIKPALRDFNSHTGIRIDWLNKLMYDIEQVNGFESEFNPNNPENNWRRTITTASHSYGPFNGRFNVRDSVYPNRLRNISTMNNGIPVYGYYLRLEYEEDLEHILDFFNGYIQNVAVPFLNTCQTLQKINDEILDWYPVGKINRHFLYHGITLKLLIMGLCENPNYDAEYRAINKLLTPKVLADEWGKSWQRVIIDIDKLANNKEKEQYEEYL